MGAHPAAHHRGGAIVTSPSVASRNARRARSCGLTVPARLERRAARRAREPDRARGRESTSARRRDGSPATRRGRPRTATRLSRAPRRGRVRRSCHRSFTSPLESCGVTRCHCPALERGRWREPARLIARPHRLDLDARRKLLPLGVGAQRLVEPAPIHAGRAVAVQEGAGLIELIRREGLGPWWSWAHRVIPSHRMVPSEIVDFGRSRGVRGVCGREGWSSPTA